MCCGSRGKIHQAFSLRFRILQAIKNWSRGRPGNETRGYTTASTPKSVSPHNRVKAYPEERLTVSNNKLFCTACREELSLKKSVLELADPSPEKLLVGDDCSVRERNSC